MKKYRNHTYRTQTRKIIDKAGTGIKQNIKYVFTLTNVQNKKYGNCMNQQVNFRISSFYRIYVCLRLVTYLTDGLLDTSEQVLLSFLVLKGEPKVRY